MNLRDTAQLGSAVLVSEWDKDDAMVCQGGEGVHRCALLTSSETGSGLEDTSNLPVEGT
jgi:hypothetical protein